MLRAYKYRIYPTDEQKVLIVNTFGCCRFVYNWALNLKIEAYRQEKKSIGNVELINRMKSELKTEHFNAACNIKEFGLKALPTERGKVRPVDCPLVDDRPRVLKSNGRKKQEKRGGIGIFEAAKSLA